MIQEGLDKLNLKEWYQMADQTNNLHHLVMGELKDFLTGEVRNDTHDERYRQKIARHLVESCGFEKVHVENNVPLKVSAGKHKAIIKVDFLVSCNNKASMIIKYGPGSLVTRRLLTIAISRILHPYQIPVAIVTNGEDAEIINAQNGQIITTGFDRIPKKAELAKINKTAKFNPISDDHFDKASRIVYAFEVDGACPCDTDICQID